MRGLLTPDLETLNQYNVNVDEQPEVLWQPLYDYQTYLAAGFTGEQLFYQVPIGQGGKTLEDTNLRSQGALPTPINMLITGVEMIFIPGVNPVGSGLPDLANSVYNDVYAVHGSRMSFTLRVGDKDSYLYESPIGVFATQFRLEGAAALSDSTTAAASQLSKVEYASFAGPMYQITPIRLISNQEFSVIIRSPDAVPLPSGEHARWGVRLHGYRYRLAQ